MSKKKRPEYVKIVCQKTLDRIEEELIKAEKKLILDKNKYQPSYIYPLIENFRKKTELSELLKETWRVYIENT